MIRKYGAHYVITGKGEVIKNGIISINDNDEIVELSQSSQNISEVSGMEFHSGVLVPGFVNAHCHLELSHLKGKIRQKTKLHGFVSEIMKLRDSDKEFIKKEVQQADKKMWHNGIVAVGDILNTNDTFETKANSKIYYHNLIEIFTSNPDFIDDRYNHALQLEKEIASFNQTCAIVPHAPYSVTPRMFQLIKEHTIKKNQTISIHNQETESENELYISRSGELHDAFVNMGVDFSAIPQTGKKSLESIMVQMPKSVKTLLVHNTFTSKNDIEKAEEYFDSVYWCMCPNANLYIEDTLPNLDLFVGRKVCFGTDSLASNHQLSILEEIKTVTENFPKIPLEKVVEWATYNGAESLNIHQKYGSFEHGKTPGINLIKNFDLMNFKLKDNSSIKKLI